MDLIGDFSIEIDLEQLNRENTTIGTVNSPTMDLLQNTDLHLLDNVMTTDNTAEESITNEVYQDLSSSETITGCGGSSESDVISAIDNVLEHFMPNNMAETNHELEDLIDLDIIENPGELGLEQLNCLRNKGKSCSINVAPTMDFGEFLNNSLIAVNSLNYFSVCPMLSCQRTASHEMPLCPSGSQISDKMKDDKEDMALPSQLQDNDVVVDIIVKKLLQTNSQDNNETDDNDGIKEFLTDGANQDRGKEAPKEPLVSIINSLMRGSLTL